MQLDPPSVRLWRVLQLSHDLCQPSGHTPYKGKGPVSHAETSEVA